MGCFYVEIEGLSSRELFLISLTIFNVKAQVPRVQQREQIILEQTFFSRVPHSGGTSVSSAGFFFEWFGKIPFDHRVSIVIGLGVIVFLVNIFQVFKCFNDVRQNK